MDTNNIRGKFKRLRLKKVLIWPRGDHGKLPRRGDASAKF